MHLNCFLKFPSNRITAQCTGYILHIPWGNVATKREMRAGTGMLAGPRDLFYSCSWAIVSSAASLGAVCAFVSAGDFASACQSPRLKHYLAQGPSKPPLCRTACHIHAKPPPPPPPNSPRKPPNNILVEVYLVYEPIRVLSAALQISLSKAVINFEVTWWEL